MQIVKMVDDTVGLDNAIKAATVIENFNANDAFSLFGNNAEDTVSDEIHNESDVNSDLMSGIDYDINIGMYKTREDAINAYVAKGKITAEEGENLKKSCVTYSESEQEEIKNYMKAHEGCTESEAINELKDANLIKGSDSLNRLNDSVLNDQVDEINQKVITGVDYKGIMYPSEYAYEYKTGRDTKSVSNFLNNPDMSDADKVSVMAKNLQDINTASILKFDLDPRNYATKKWDFVPEKASITTDYADLLLREAEKGNKEAVKVLCQEIYLCGPKYRNQDNKVNDKFINHVFNNASPELVNTLNQEYKDSVNELPDVQKGIEEHNNSPLFAGMKK